MASSDKTLKPWANPFGINTDTGLSLSSFIESNSPNVLLDLLRSTKTSLITPSRQNIILSTSFGGF